MAIYVRLLCCIARLLTRSGDSIAQHRKSNKRLHKTFGWILVETADFKNRGIMLQWCLFVERDENYALYNGRGGCHLRFFERAFGAGRCESVCAEAKRRVSARCSNGNAAARGLPMGGECSLLSEALLVAVT